MVLWFTHWWQGFGNVPWNFQELHPDSISYRLGQQRYFCFILDWRPNAWGIWYVALPEPEMKGALHRTWVFSVFGHFSAAMGMAQHHWPKNGWLIVDCQPDMVRLPWYLSSEPWSMVWSIFYILELDRGSISWMEEMLGKKLSPDLLSSWSEGSAAISVH